jgi:hypothetical protein
MEHPPTEWASDAFGGNPPTEVLDLCFQVSQKIKDYVIDTADWWKPGNIDWIRLRIQLLLLEFACEVTRMDRQSGPNMFGTVPQKIEPEKKWVQPSLRSWIRRNGRKVHHENP